MITVDDVLSNARLAAFARLVGAILPVALVTDNDFKVCGLLDSSGNPVGDWHKQEK